MAEKSHDIFPRDPNKTYGLMELVKGTATGVDKEPEDTIFSWPHLFYIEFLCVLIVTGLLLFSSIYLGAPLEEEASRGTTPNTMKAPRCFLGLEGRLLFF